MTQKSEPKAKSDLSILDHLRELRKRLISSLIIILVMSIICFAFTPEIFEFLCGPYAAAFKGHSLIGTGPAEAFMLKISVAIFAGIVISLPLLFYQFWLFISPGLFEQEKKLVYPFVLLTSLLFLAGMAFCYYIMLPVSMLFFQDQYKSINLAPQIRMTEHLSLLVHLLLGFGVVFEMPVVAYFLGKAGVIDYKMMLKWARHAIVLIFVIAAILTPPDVVSQMAMAIPLLVLYGVSILVVKYGV